MFMLWCGDVLGTSFIFVHVWFRETGRGIGNAPHQKHKRYQQP